MSKYKQFPVILVVVLLATAVWPNTAFACSWPANLFENGIRESRKVEGTIQISSAEETTITWTDGTEHPWSRIFRATVTDLRGRKYEVVYEISVLGCTPFKAPETNVSGVFYLKRKAPNEYVLRHWDDGQ